eukprot:3854172-Pyramimonas_sp.AAC.1
MVRLCPRLSPMLAIKGWERRTAAALSCTRRRYANATLSHRPRFIQSEFVTTRRSCSSTWSGLRWGDGFGLPEICVIDDGFNYIGTKINSTINGTPCASGAHFSMRVCVLYNVQWRAREREDTLSTHQKSERVHFYSPALAVSLRETDRMQYLFRTFDRLRS